ncbi:hypothetical protein [Polynucleobacter sp.]|uniref:hypothetical protein n=1 Tax=Polynucleobacter sp. TaxID=2029855 RepID=UPI003F69C735
MILEELANHIESLDSTYQVGDNLFIGELPQGIENATMLVSTSSEQPDMYTGIEYQSFDIWSRYDKVAEGYQAVNDLFIMFNRKGDFYLPNYEVYFCHALGRIDDFDRDIEGRKMFRLPMKLIYRQLIFVS